MPTVQGGSSDDRLAAGLEPPGRFQILALDGGGIRGLYTASVLAGLEQDFGIQVADHFDLIVGTSTGGIVAIALGLGVPPAEIVRLYSEEGCHIFPAANGLLRRLRHLWRTKYDANHLTKCMRQVFGERIIGESSKGLAIPAYNLEEDKPCIFKTPHHPSLVRDKVIPVWKVALATSAAPTYFPAATHVGHVRHVDGGVWANNPSLVGVIEAHRFLGIPLDRIRVLSIGTANCVKERAVRLDGGGLWAWKDAAVDVILSGQSQGTDNQVRLLLGDDRVYRLNPTVPESWSAMDVMRHDGFAGRAWQGSKELAPVFDRDFRPHRGLALEELRSLGEAAATEKEHVANLARRAD